MSIISESNNTIIFPTISVSIQTTIANLPYLFIDLCLPNEFLPFFLNNNRPFPHLSAYSKSQQKTTADTSPVRLSFIVC